MLPNLSFLAQQQIHVDAKRGRDGAGEEEADDKEVETFERTSNDLFVNSTAFAIICFTNQWHRHINLFVQHNSWGSLPLTPFSDILDESHAVGLAMFAPISFIQEVTGNFGEVLPIGVRMSLYEKVSRVLSGTNRCDLVLYGPSSFLRTFDQTFKRSLRTYVQRAVQNGDLEHQRVYNGGVEACLRKMVTSMKSALVPIQEPSCVWFSEVNSRDWSKYGFLRTSTRLDSELAIRSAETAGWSDALRRQVHIYCVQLTEGVQVISVGDNVPSAQRCVDENEIILSPDTEYKRVFYTTLDHAANTTLAASLDGPLPLEYDPQIHKHPDFDQNKRLLTLDTLVAVQRQAWQLLYGYSSVATLPHPTTPHLVLDVVVAVPSLFIRE